MGTGIKIELTEQQMQQISAAQPTGDSPVHAGAPVMQSWSFSGSPVDDGTGHAKEDFWMRSKTGCMKGGIIAEWTVWNQWKSMMGGVTEFEVVVASQDTEWTAGKHVKKAWEPEVNWCDEPAQTGDNLNAAWAEYYARFIKAHQYPSGKPDQGAGKEIPL